MSFAAARRHQAGRTYQYPTNCWKDSSETLSDCCGRAVRFWTPTTTSVTVAILGSAGLAATGTIFSSECAPQDLENPTIRCNEDIQRALIISAIVGGVALVVSLSALAIICCKSCNKSGGGAEFTNGGEVGSGIEYVPFDGNDGD